MGDEKSKCFRPIRDAVKVWNKDNHKLLLERVENRCVPGMPDVYIECANGNIAWVELKYSEEFPSKVALRPEQVIWLDQHSKVGRNSFILLRTKHEYHLWSGLFAKGIAVGKNMDSSIYFGVDEKSRLKLLKYLIGD